MKILKINRCRDCKWHDRWWCYHPEIQTETVKSRELFVGGIPDWCLLDDEGKYLKSLTIGDFLDIEYDENPCLTEVSEHGGEG